MPHKKIWKQIVSIEIDNDRQHMVQIQELIELLHKLEESNENESSQSSQSVIGHSIDICQNYLINMLKLEKQRFQISETKEHNKQLCSQLNRALDLLSASELSNTVIGHDHQESDVNNLKEQVENTQEVSEANMEIQPLFPEIVPEDIKGDYEQEALPADRKEVEREKIEKEALSIDVLTFDQFNVFINSCRIESWSNGKGKQLFKFLVVKRASPVPKEVLMEVFWPTHNAASARNNLNVAIYSLRQTLKIYIPEISCVLFKHGCYQLNPVLHIWVDCEAFDRYYKKAQGLETKGEAGETIAEYKKIEKIYRGDFLAEDSYEEWTLLLRESYRDAYIETLNKLDQYYYDNDDLHACVHINKRIIEIDSCNEIAHQRLMENYTKSGQRHLALRQYHACADALKSRFNLQPSEGTINLFNRVKRVSINEA